MIVEPVISNDGGGWSKIEFTGRVDDDCGVLSGSKGASASGCSLRFRFEGLSIELSLSLLFLVVFAEEICSWESVNGLEGSTESIHARMASMRMPEEVALH